MDLIVIPFCILSLSFYLSLIFLGNHTYSWIIGLITALALIFLLFRNNYRQHLTELKELLKFSNLPLLGAVLGMVLLTGAVLSPFIITKHSGNFEHIQITDVGDYYKHTFVTNAISQDGLPPSNPYFPISKLSYYYGYYLIPAFITHTFRVPAHLTFYWYSLFTDLIALLIPTALIILLIKRPLYRYLSLLLILTGVGVDTIPFIFDTAGQLQIDEGLQLINVYKALLFVPQHLFASALTVWIISSLIRKRASLLTLSIMIAMVFLSSLFVSITLLIWCSIYFLFYNQKLLLIKSAFLTGLLLLPYLLLLKGRGNLFYLYQLDPYNYGSYPLSVLYTFYLKYGPFVLLAPVIILVAKNLPKAYLLGFTSIIGMSWFVRSPIFNDLSMRTSIPIWLSLPIVIFYLAEKSKSKLIQLSVLMITILTLFIGVRGVLWEYSKHYKDRIFLNPNESELILALRKLPQETTLASVDKTRTVEYTPSLTGKRITSPYLFDSYVYFADGFGSVHGEYERWADQTFHSETLSKTVEENIQIKNAQFAELFQYFSKYPTTKLLVTNKLWVKKDTNPWLIIFRESGINHSDITPNYTLFDYPDLLTKLSGVEIMIDQSQTKLSAISDSGSNLPKGLWYLTSCKPHTPAYLRLELNDYYILFDKTLEDENLCAGQLFFMENEGRITFTNTSNPDNIFYSPVIIKPSVLE